MRYFTFSTSLACYLLLSTHVFAASPHSLSATTFLATDYMFRGVSQTNNDPTLWLGIDYAHESGFYGGLFFANVDYDTDTRREEDIYVGYSKSFENGISLDAQAWYYTYRNESDLDYPEYTVGLQYKWFDARYWYSDDYSGTGGEQHYYEAGLTVPLLDNLELGVRAAHTDFGRDTGIQDYNDYSLSLAATYHGFEISMLATTTNEDQFGELEDSRVVFGISKTFNLLP